MDVIKVSDAEFQRNMSRYQDIALSQPVTVTRDGRESTVLISTEEYRRLKRRERRVMGPEDFTEADIAALEAARAPADADAFDDELTPTS
jgi:prevent-host-death family protein